MKPGLLLFFSLLAGSGAVAQPQYRLSTNDNKSNLTIANTRNNFRLQSLYSATDFPGVPAGHVKAVYYRVAHAAVSADGAGSALIDSVAVKIGYVSDSAFAKTPDLLRTGLTTLYGPDTFTASTTAIGGDWVRIPVTKGNFQYQPQAGSFAVELYVGLQSNHYNGFHYVATSVVPVAYRRTALATSTHLNEGFVTSMPVDIGFDFGQPAGIASSSSIESAGLFPNPSADGRVNISLEMKDPIREAAVHILSMTGQVLHTQSLPSGGNRLFQQLALNELPKGVYLVRILANGERINHRLILQ